MQDQYAGDIGDYGKFGLLRILAATGLIIGVNWYRTVDVPSGKSDNGRFVHYFSKSDLKSCDPALIETLEEIVQGNRSIRALEEKQLIPRAIYFSRPLRPEMPTGFSRSKWHRKAMRALGKADIVFCDPDNGLLAPSVSLRSGKSVQYITIDEIAECYSAGKSVIFYNHRCRQKESRYLQRFLTLKELPSFQQAAWLCLSYRRGTVRDYFFVLQPRHTAAVQKAVSGLLDSNWSRHFTKLDFERATAGPPQLADKGGMLEAPPSNHHAVP